MFRRIVIAIQEPAEQGLLMATAARLACPGDSTVLALHIRKLDERTQLLTRDEELVDELVGEARRLGLRAESEILEIPADREVGRAIADVARGWRADLVVAGSRRLSDLQAVLHGSVSHNLIQFAGCPVMIAPRSGAAEPVGSILLAVDASRSARAAEQLAAEVARAGGAKVFVLHVAQPVVAAGPLFSGIYVPSPLPDQVALSAGERLRAQGISVELLDELPGAAPTSSAIAAAADRIGAALVILGSRGLGGVAGLLRGSVSHEVIH